MNITQKDIDRFWSKVDKKGKDDCWEWTAYKSSGGYGHFRFRGKDRGTHRFSWLLHNGIIPEGLCVLHDCDNPACVNPAHLFLGTHKDNTQDSIKKGRWPDRNGEAAGGSKLTEAQVLSIRAEYKIGNISQRELARKYNVSHDTIWRIVTRKSWRHI